MKEKSIRSHDGVEIKYSVSEVKSGKPWIALILPFGLKLQMAKYFFEFFDSNYNLVTWESRSILESVERKISENEFNIENHVLDLKTVLTNCPAEQFIVVGYCSGAGVALGAANRFPRLISELLLVHGEYTMLSRADCTTQFASEIDSLLSLAAKDEEHLGLVFEKIKNERFEETSNRPNGIDLPFTELHYLRRHSANYLAYKQEDFENLARFVSHRTLLISGELDVQANATSSKRIHEIMPNSEIYIDPQSDHYGVLREDSSVMITIWNYLCGIRSRAT